MRATLLPLLIIIATAAIAQSPYRPFPEVNAGWVEGDAWLSPNGPSCADYTWINCGRPVYFGEDTTINGVSYHRLRYHGLCNWQQAGGPMPPPPWCEWSGTYSEPQQDYCYFRQDVDERRVYIYDTLDGQEELLYDFTMGLGTYPITYNNLTATGELQVVALDSMELNDGWHRTWVLGIEWQGQLLDSAFCTVIEGVGSTFGVTDVLWPPFENGNLLICHSVAGAAVYPFGDVTCDLAMHAPQVQDAPELSAVPNPATDAVQVKGVALNAEFFVADLVGRQVATGRLIGARLDCSDWSPGMYVITIRDGQRAQRSLRVLKE